MMNKYLTIFFFLISTIGVAQQNNLTKKGVIAKGYDVTEYFNNNAVKGDSKFQSTFNGAIYYFVNEKNKAVFDANPEAFIPQYGGYCAYAIGEKNSKVSINPKSYLVEDGKLYLFYDNAFIDTKQKWLENNPTQLKQKADAHWSTLKNQ